MPELEDCKMGKNMKRMLLFAIRYRGWHSWAKDRSTCDAVKRLKRLGFIETNEFRQFRLAQPSCQVFFQTKLPELKEL